MAPPRKGLGKGLSALMSDEYSSNADQPESGDTIRQLPLDALVSGRFQPRTRFDPAYLDELAESIRKNGIMQPIVARPLAGKKQAYEIIAGERRWRAARIAGLTQLPVLVREADDRQALELALVENIQRQDLGPLEEARGYKRLIDEFAYTQETLAATVGKSRSHVANLMRLLGLPEAIRAHLDADRLSMGHARALLAAPNAEALAEEVIRRGLNVRQTEALARGGSGTAPKASRPARQASAQNGSKDPDILALEETLSENLGLGVSIDDQGQRGSIILRYESLAQLDDILKRLGGGA